MRVHPNRLRLLPRCRRSRPLRRPTPLHTMSRSRARLCRVLRSVVIAMSVRFVMAVMVAVSVMSVVSAAVVRSVRTSVTDVSIVPGVTVSIAMVVVIAMSVRFVMAVMVAVSVMSVVSAAVARCRAPRVRIPRVRLSRVPRLQPQPAIARMVRLPDLVRATIRSAESRACIRPRRVIFRVRIRWRVRP